MFKIIFMINIFMIPCVRCPYRYDFISSIHMRATFNIGNSYHAFFYSLKLRDLVLMGVLMVVVVLMMMVMFVFVVVDLLNGSRSGRGYRCWSRTCDRSWIGRCRSGSTGCKSSHGVGYSLGSWWGIFRY
jgi:hypothetical protein